MTTKQKQKQKSKYTPGDYQLIARRSAPGAGIGLFAGEDIPKGVCVIEYVGRQVSKEEETTSKSKYLFEISKNKTIDGKPKWNKAGYINHSCKGNCEPEIRGGRVLIMSVRAIKKGEELGYDYGKDYYLEHVAPLGCRCSAPKHLYLQKTTKKK